MLLVARLVFNLAALLLWGGSVCLLLIADRSLRAAFWQRLFRWGVGAAALAGLSTFVTLPMLTASLGGGWKEALDVNMLTLVVTRTVVGSAWGGQLAACVALGAVLLVRPLRRPAGVGVASALMLATLTVSGHTAMHDGVIGMLHRFNDWGHLLAGGFWLGALVPVVLLLRCLKAADTRAAAIQALIRFSSVGHLVVALAVLTGIMNTWLVVGGLPLDSDVLYQRSLWLKVALVALLIVIALYNRYRLVPRLSRDPGALAILRRVSIAEIVILVMVVALVSWFGTLSPGHG
ncbi:copper resistance protein D [Kushneria pakistanensis]|uniref:Copper resistance protein D n=2 Tax=Kushneria pakistanensis TaxID=1508770 RepID=A0ABQ3FJZ8_9GAMM|nr:copper resistance protein D [Kushneria pakistanensis]